LKILLLGANGQVGWELQRSLAPLGQLLACDRDCADLDNFDQLRTTIREYSPDIIVNAAAYTAVDQAESEPDKAQRINAEAVGLIATETKRLGAWLVHYSTDYVFDGSKATAYTETDLPNPVSVYGQSKLAGEEAIRDSSCDHLIFRTSWVYAARGSNFAKTMLRLASQRDELKVVSDQIGAPTSAELIADVTALCLNRILVDQPFGEQAGGTYHLSPGGETNWHEYAQYVISEALQAGFTLNARPEQIHPIATSEYPLPARRPANSRLDTTKLINMFKIYLPHWQYHVKRLVSEYSIRDEL